jgi:hypothetical protein
MNIVGRIKAVGNSNEVILLNHDVNKYILSLGDFKDILLNTTDRNTRTVM